jgi:DNA-binding NtrC family response regulator
MERVRTFARRAARVNVPVLILGETGTGKSLLGKVIHRESSRTSGPYLAINCAGIPDSLFESEFFGHQRGAFTGAREGRRGILEQAQGGSLFLDEVGELTVSQQAKLLMALEDGEIRRLGGEGTVKVDVRVLAATSRDLPREMREGGFRRELFHRLAVLTCHIPPLRARREDVPLLARRLLRKHQDRHGCPFALLSPDTLRYLEDQPWPGNVRELSHLLEAALILSEGGVLEVNALQAAGAMSDGGEENSGEKGPDPKGPPEAQRYAFLGSEDEEREAIRSALDRARGNKSRAARELGMARNTLRQKLRKYALG